MSGLTASQVWKKVFTSKHLRTLFYDKIKEKASVGLDWVTVETFERKLEDNINIILRKCNMGNYVFTRYKEMLISKGADKPPRRISIPTVRDRLVLAALSEVFENVYHSAATTQMPQVIINEIVQTMKEKSFDTYIKMDIKTFYASINHNILFKRLRKRIKKDAIYKLVECAVCTSTVPSNTLATCNTNDVGVPEGLAISNLLANIYMQPIDDYFHSRNDCIYFRYVDDILILTTSHDAIQIKEKLIQDISDLFLTLNEEKTHIGKIEEGFEFLGYFISPLKVSVRRSSIICLERTLEMLFRNYHKMDKPNIKYLKWKVNLKVTGFILEGHKYGWVFFYSQINDLYCLFHLDWLISTLCQRFNIKEREYFKSFLRTYHEITKALHTTKYIPNLDKMTIKEKRIIIQEIYNEDCRNYNDELIEIRFKKIMSKEIRDIQKDVQPFS